ncbi:MAG TPA: hypothetical protein VL172_22655, partial [Kofleriaceae bacterium]|nr:hypothetical protein [Kofleriaceae bacterium]
MTAARIWAGGAAVDVDPARLLGTGGEAEVYDVGGGRALKLFKPPDHPDLAGQPAAQEAARRRLAELPERLAEFPRGLPARVVAPERVATRGRRGPVAGYLMRLVPGAESMWSLGDLAARRRPGAGNRAVAVLRDLHATVSAVHAAGVVIGDFNDLNVLVAGERTHLIDADSFQYGRWPCPLFTERFVDPRLCDADALVLRRPHDPDSDWYAFAAMLVRLLLGVGPWGGVHRPPSGPAVAPAARPLHRISFLHRDVIPPRAAIPARALPDELLSHLAAIFERDQRGPFPATLLDRLRWTFCPTCNAEHARPICPTCAGTPTHLPSLTIRGHLRVEVLDELPGVAPDRFWLHAGLLYRAGLLGPEVVGTVPAGRTHLWIGASRAFGIWQLGRLLVAFTARDRGGLLEGPPLPPPAGRVVDRTAVVGTDHTWLFTTYLDTGRMRITCQLLATDGHLLATTTADAADPGWLAAAAGACAAG